MADTLEHISGETLAPASESTIPDFLADPDAVSRDDGVQWRYGSAPNYSKTRQAWQETKQMSHEAGSLPQLVENLVKNWEVEASFKLRLSDWRTIDPEKYTFSMNGGPPQSGEHMLKVGTYNAIICPNEYYSPEHCDFAASHKTFKRMMPTFAWEVVEVYSGPPIVAFKWRHWGVMKSDYVAFNDQNQKVTAIVKLLHQDHVLTFLASSLEAHGGPIEVFGVTVAKVDDALRIQTLNTWMDPLSMFRQIAPYGVVNKAPAREKANNVSGNEVMTGNDCSSLATGVDVSSETHQEDLVSGGAPELESAVETDERETSHANDETVHTTNASPSNAPAPHSIGADDFEVHRETPHEVHQSGSTCVESSKAEVDAGQILESGWSSNQAEAAAQSAPTIEHRIVHDKATEEAAPSDHSPNEMKRPIDVSEPKTMISLTEESEKTEPRLEPTDVTKADHETPPSLYSSAVTGNIEDLLRVDPDETIASNGFNISTQEVFDSDLGSSTKDQHPTNVEQAVEPQAGEAVVAPADSHEAKQTSDEMSKVTLEEKDKMMNLE